MTKAVDKFTFSCTIVEMLLHYWKIGHFILFNQEKSGWSSKFIEQTSQVLRKLHPEKKGYYPRNLTYMCQFAKLYTVEIIEQLIKADKELENPTLEKVLSVTKFLNECQFMQKVPAQIKNVSNTISQHTTPQMEKYSTRSSVFRINWTSHIVLMDSNLPLGSRYWYMKQSVEFGWSSTILKMQIENDLFKRQIEKQKINNFAATLPKPQSDLANYLLKDPYIFDLACIKERTDERDIEEQLVNHVIKYLLEMGNGFAFVARQKHFQIGSSDFYPDLILYNIKLHTYVVVELKANPFKPEYAGQLNFYINVVDDKLRGENDNKTIGLLLCKGKDEIMTQYALSGYNQPISVNDYQLSKVIPEELPEVEEELFQILEDKA